MVPLNSIYRFFNIKVFSKIIPKFLPKSKCDALTKYVIRNKSISMHTTEEGFEDWIDFVKGSRHVRKNHKL